MTNTPIYICISFDEFGLIEDIELLDSPPQRSFIDGYRDLRCNFEIREASINGGDSEVIMRG